MYTPKHPTVRSANVLFLGLAFTISTLVGCGEPVSPNDDTEDVALASVSTAVGEHTLAAEGIFIGDMLFRIKNISSEGVNIANVIVDLNPSRENALFDPLGGAPGAGKSNQFTTTNGWDVGLYGWAGDIVGSADINDPDYGLLGLGLNRVVDGAKYLHMGFDWFGPGLTFMFAIDVDAMARGRYTDRCYGSCLQGARITMVFTAPGMDPTPVTVPFVRTSWLTAGF